MTSVVAIVGRPNVGKSTLFNILTGSKAALVADFSGLTRDRQYGTVKNSSTVLIDTGGISAESNDISKAVKNQAEAAIEEADILFFLVDGMNGLLPLDEDIAASLRKTNKKIYLLVNKIDGIKQESSMGEFNKLGFKDLINFSAAHNRGIQDIKEVLEEFEESADLPQDLEEDVKISIIGRPNAGKSTLVNKLIGKDRVLVSSESGTTRDSIEVPLEWKGKNLTLVDTAGMRRKRSITEGTEKSSVSQSVEAIRKAHVVILVLDSSETIVDQDIHLLGLSLALGRPVIIAANKLDLLSSKQKEDLKENIERKLRFAEFLEIKFISAKDGRGVNMLINLAEKAYLSSVKDLQTPLLNRILKAALQKQPPPMSGRFRPKMRYAHAGSKNPPSIIIHGNNLKIMPESYRKFLENFFRQRLNLGSTPLVIRYREGENPYKDNPNILTERQKKKRKRLTTLVKKRNK
jgi:GTP-binding protein